MRSPHFLNGRRPRLAFLSAATVFAAGAAGTAATIPNIATWYAALRKPPFTPPNWVFGPAWTVLYVLMAVAFWRVLILPAETKGRRSAITWFFIQLLLNAFWSIAFFGFHAPWLGLVTIGLLIGALIITIIQFSAVDRVAGPIMIPYLLWVGFASALNAAVVWLNR